MIMAKKACIFSKLTDDKIAAENAAAIRGALCRLDR